MTLDELKEWIDESECIDNENRFDDRGNNWAFSIYKRDGKFYRIDSCNGYPTEKWSDGHGYIKGVYEPREVVRKEEIVTEVYYEEVQ